jgi:hypothetical protein
MQPPNYALKETYTKEDKCRIWGFHSNVNMDSGMFLQKSGHSAKILHV